MNKDATVHARMDEQIKNDAIEVFNELGLSVSEAITLFFKQVALKNAIPFELSASRKASKSNVDKNPDDDIQIIFAVLDNDIKMLGEETLKELLQEQ